MDASELYAISVRLDQEADGLARLGMNVKAARLRSIVSDLREITDGNGNQSAEDATASAALSA